MVRASLGVNAPGAARWLSFGPSCCLLRVWFLIPSLPAVCDLGQETAELLNIAISPQMYIFKAGVNDFGWWNFSSLDVSA